MLTEQLQGIFAFYPQFLYHSNELDRILVGICLYGLVDLPHLYCHYYAILSAQAAAFSIADADMLAAGLIF